MSWKEVTDLSQLGKLFHSDGTLNPNFLKNSCHNKKGVECV